VGQQFRRTGDTTSFPKWSRDGRQISFCNLGKTSDIPPSGFYVVNVDGTGERRVAPLPGMVHAVWRDAAEVVYFLKRRNGNASDLEMRTLNTRTGAATESFRAVGLPKWVSLRELSWSKDCNRALVVASEREGPVGDIYLIDILKRRTRRLTNDGRNAWPSWSGDESEIAFLRDTVSLWTMSSEGTRQRKMLDIAALASAAR